MAVQMTPYEVRAFLTATPPHTGKLATTRADGAPHVAPVWFDVDTDPGDDQDRGGDILFMTGAATAKGRDLARDPRAALCVDDERPPFAFVVIEGTVELSEDPDELRRWATRYRRTLHGNATRGSLRRSQRSPRRATGPPPTSEDRGRSRHGRLTSATEVQRAKRCHPSHIQPTVSTPRAATATKRGRRSSLRMWAGIEGATRTIPRTR